MKQRGREEEDDVHDHDDDEGDDDDDDDDKDASLTPRGKVNYEKLSFSTPRNCHDFGNKMRCFIARSQEVDSGSILSQINPIKNLIHYVSRLSSQVPSRSQLPA